MNAQPSLETLRDRHRAVDQQIMEKTNHPGADPNEIYRLKREKLHLKDQIERISH